MTPTPTASSDTVPPEARRLAVIEELHHEFDILCRGIPGPEAIASALCIAGFAE